MKRLLIDAQEYRDAQTLRLVDRHLVVAFRDGEAAVVLRVKFFEHRVSRFDS